MLQRLLGPTLVLHFSFTFYMFSADIVFNKCYFISLCLHDIIIRRRCTCCLFLESLSCYIICTHCSRLGTSACIACSETASNIKTHCIRAVPLTQWLLLYKWHTGLQSQRGSLRSWLSWNESCVWHAALSMLILHPSIKDCQFNFRSIPWSSYPVMWAQANLEVGQRVHPVCSQSRGSIM